MGVLWSDKSLSDAAEMFNAAMPSGTHHLAVISDQILIDRGAQWLADCERAAARERFVALGDMLTGTREKFRLQATIARNLMNMDTFTQCADQALAETSEWLEGPGSELHHAPSEFEIAQHAVGRFVAILAGLSPLHPAEPVRGLDGGL